jgi:FkbM family methyltransferase
MKDRLKRWAWRLGWDVRRVTPGASYEAARSELIHEAAVTALLDIGANVGDYASARRTGGYRGRIVSFEPLAAPFAELRARSEGDGAWECHQLALSDVDGERKMNVAANRAASSSFLPMRAQHLDAAPDAEYVGTETVRLARLDSLASDILAPDERAFAKLDVQGFESRVLDGGRKTLSRLVALELELSLVELYEGQPLIGEMLERIQAEGFGVRAIDPGLRDAAGCILQVDALCVRY